MKMQIGGFLKRLEKVAKKRAADYERGVKKAGLFLQRESQLLAPVETGVMRNSAFTRASGAGFDVVVTVGYTAAYAVFVHENLEARHKKGKQAKFLEQPAREKRPEMAAIIEKEMRR